MEVTMVLVKHIPGPGSTICLIRRVGKLAAALLADDTRRLDSTTVERDEDG